MSIERDHALIEELLSAEVLGGLEPAERAALDRERAAHGACDECARLEAELSEVAGRLALSLDPVPVRPGMAEDILRAAGAARVATSAPVTTSAAAPVRLADRRADRNGTGWRALVAVAAAFALFVGGYAVRDLTSGGSDSPPRLVRFGGTGSAGTLAMAYRPGEPGVVFFGSGLADPGAGRVYEIWMIAGKGTPVSGGCVRPQEGQVLTYVDADLGTSDTMAVTVEPSSCPSAPTTDPVLTASLS